MITSWLMALVKNASTRLRGSEWRRGLVCDLGFWHTCPAKLSGELIMPTGTVRLHRVLRAKPEKIYRAFLSADALSKWLPPYGFTCKVQHLDARVGGTFRMSFENFSTGNGHALAVIS
jgi:hypothetical protein